MSTKLKHIEEGLPIIFTSGMTGLTAIFGGWDTAFQVFIFLVVLDIVTGVVKGVLGEGFSSKRMRKGFATKFGYFVVIMLATQFDRLMPEDAPILRTIAIWFYIAVESGSLLENLAQMGVPIPQAIVDRLEVFKGKSGDKASMDTDREVEK